MIHILFFLDCISVFNINSDKLRKRTYRGFTNDEPRGLLHIVGLSVPSSSFYMYKHEGDRYMSVDRT